MNQQTWIERGKELARTHSSSHWELGDWMCEGEKSFSKTTAIDLAQKATKLGRFFLYRVGAVARRYKSALRFPTLSISTYMALKNFPLDFLEKFLPSVADAGLSMNQILARAVKEYGSDPAPRRRPAKYHKVRIFAGLYEKLHAARLVTALFMHFPLSLLDDALLLLVAKKRENHRRRTRNA